MPGGQANKTFVSDFTFVRDSAGKSGRQDEKCAKIKHISTRYSGKIREANK